ncbi:hypothetical protein [Microbacterium saperdae]|uniref:Uncharacterized protein n=1 Tax=Microbacterium saperdae TaxID=69368 RepID=A0A543BQY1_9MICO|nr:hypothetical protein [Microbacterium saperdae]TQL87234.1 hypothetical protein FB560_2901 [Microbacterium saperdae]GGM41916.1 hypothetical protein GCM10010489_11140 [Microbacterium saperdae]
MIGIVGVDLTQNQVKGHLERYLVAYFETMDRAIEANGGSLACSVIGDDPWRPDLPIELRPSWLHSFHASADKDDFFIDLRGPVLNDIFVCQAVEIDLEWKDPTSPSGFVILDFRIESLGIHMIDDRLDLEKARAITSGLIAAGKLMAALLEAPQEVR